MRLEDEFLHKYLGGNPQEVLSWKEYQDMANMLTSYMQFLEDREWEEDWDEEELKNTNLGEYITAIVQCEACGYAWPAHFPSHRDTLECPSCKIMSYYKIL